MVLYSLKVALKVFHFKNKKDYGFFEKRIFNLNLFRWSFSLMKTGQLMLLLNKIIKIKGIYRYRLINILRNLIGLVKI